MAGKTAMGRSAHLFTDYMDPDANTLDVSRELSKRRGTSTTREFVGEMGRMLTPSRRFDDGEPGADVRESVDEAGRKKRGQ